MSSFTATESPTQIRPEPRRYSCQLLEQHAQLSAEAQSLRAKAKLLRLEYLKVMVDLALNFATFPRAMASDKLVRSCYKAALKAYSRTGSIAEGVDGMGTDNIEVKEGLKRLRAILEGGKRAAVQLDDGAGAIAPHAVERESAIHQSNGHAPDSLTRRELEVLKCIAEGHATKDAAFMLGITFKTAACHRYHIMDKLGMHSISSLVRYAVRIGLVKA